MTLFVIFLLFAICEGSKDCSVNKDSLDSSCPTCLSGDDPQLMENILSQIEPPSTEKLNFNQELVANDHLVGMFLKIVVFQDQTEKGVFVEVVEGKSGGIGRLSNTLLLELVDNWKGIIIESDPQEFEMGKDVHRQAWRLNGCLSSGRTSELFNRTSTTDKRICYPLQSIIKVLKRPVNYLSLSTERNTLSLLESLTWDTVDVQVISYNKTQQEKLFPGNSVKLNAYLQTQEYTYIGEIQGTSIFIRNDLYNGKLHPNGELFDMLMDPKLDMDLLLFNLRVHGEGLKAKTSVASSCPEADTESSWETSNIELGLKSWLNSLTTVAGEGRVTSRMYDRVNSRLYTHTFGYEDDAMTNATEEDRAVVTLSLAPTDSSTGIVWQRVSRYRKDGYLYKDQVQQVDPSFTGDSITFIYPDLLTGIRGRFENGLLVEGVEVEIVGHRCVAGVKELKFEVVNPSQIWRSERTNETFIGSHPTVMDPHERKSVYAKNSSAPNSGEGLFARRNFIAGELISYFHGVLVNITKVVNSDVVIGMGNSAPRVWNVSSDTVVDVPVEKRETDKYCTTLGHKANHLPNSNSGYSVVLHPVFGPTACIEALQPIMKDEEIFVDYKYKNHRSNWYQQAENVREMLDKIE